MVNKAYLGDSECGSAMFGQGQGLKVETLGEKIDRICQERNDLAGKAESARINKERAEETLKSVTIERDFFKKRVTEQGVEIVALRKDLDGALVRVHDASHNAQLACDNATQARVERDALRTEVQRWHDAAMQAGVITHPNGVLEFPVNAIALRNTLEQVEADLAATRLQSAQWASRALGAEDKANKLTIDRDDAIADSNRVLERAEAAEVKCQGAERRISHLMECAQKDCDAAVKACKERDDALNTLEDRNTALKALLVRESGALDQRDRCAAQRDAMAEERDGLVKSLHQMRDDYHEASNERDRLSGIVEARRVVSPIVVGDLVMNASQTDPFEGIVLVIVKDRLGDSWATVESVSGGLRTYHIGRLMRTKP